MRVAFVIPAYNEATVIPNVLKDLKKALAKTKLDYEIVVVDDGSSDKTGEIVKNEDVFVISHILNSGSGSATATGLSYAQQSGFDIAATLDADGQHDPSEVIKGVELIQKKKPTSL